MIVGVLKEIKAEENRVCMTPAGVEIIGQNGHTVLVEKNAGKGSGFTNKAYETAGAEIVDTPQEIFKRAKMVMHVKEPLPAEYDLIRKDQIIFTYLHLAAAEELTKVLIKSGSIGIAYETIQKDDGSLPLLTPMSEVAGRMSIQEGAKFLEHRMGGRGVLLGGVPGVLPAKVAILGGGVVGDMAGSVEHIGIKTTRIRSISGEQLVFSNSDLLSSRIRNYGRMYERRIVFNLGVTYQTPREKLKKIPGIIRAAVENQEKTRFDRSHFKAYGDFALDFETVYYVLEPDYNVYMDIQQSVNLAIHERFEQETIEFAYPTQTVYVERVGVSAAGDGTTSSPPDGGTTDEQSEATG